MYVWAIVADYCNSPFIKVNNSGKSGNITLCNEIKRAILLNAGCGAYLSITRRSKYASSSLDSNHTSSNFSVPSKKWESDSTPAISAASGQVTTRDSWSI